MKIGMIVTTPTVAATFQSMGRWALMSPAAPSGIVLSACELMRYSPTRNSFQMKMRAKMAATTMPGRTSGSMTRQQDAEPRAAVDQRRVVELARDLVEEADEDPDRQRQAEGDVGDDQTRIGVVEVDERIISRIGMATATGGMKRKLRIVVAQRSRPRKRSREKA